MSPRPFLSTTPVSDLKSAARHFAKWTGYRLYQRLFRPGRRVPVAIVYKHPERDERYCVTFKRGWYQNFGFHFPKCPDRGYGQIASLNLLRFCRKEGIAWIVAVMPEGVAYKIDVADFLGYYEEHRTDVPHLPGEVAAPIRMWQRMFPM